MIINADNIETLRAMEPDSVDSIVTDPPYGLSFMAKRWDYDVPTVELWAECLRVLKPGGHLLAFAGTRTQHRMAVRIEDAGFEIRDMIAWVYGSGFPKSRNIGKTLPEWDGWGTGLKPSHEPVTVARKPFRGTVAANVLEHGTGGINVDGCRVGARSENESRWSRTGSKAGGNVAMSGANYARGPKNEAGVGRWPANLIHDGSPEVMELFPATAKGSSARFFYCPKASRKEREAGLDDFAPKQQDETRAEGSPGGDNPRNRGAKKRANGHPTVKPVALMRYLCRLVTPPGGLVLDPFAGSGTTGIAACAEGFRFIGIEISEEYANIAKARINHERSSK